MRKIVLGLLAASALVGSASAADLGLRPSIMKSPPLVPGFSWTGFYVGVNAGSGWGSTTEDLTGLTVGPFNVIGNQAMGNFSSAGFLGGAQAGFNYQIQSVVLGVELEGDMASIKGHAPCLALLTCSQNTKWLADASGRVGLALDRALIYVKGGYAWAANNYETSFGPLDAMASSTRTGGLFGAGIEYAITDHVTAKLEYDHIDFGSKNLGVPVTITGVKVPINAAINYGQTLDIVKVGLNYKFGPL